jgi:ubiquinone/menaquinone biosynthesis C-methylase UbiE
MLSDWRSYDDIAEGYDRVWSAPFETVARQIWVLVPPQHGDKVLDIGTGTGIVPGILADVAPGALLRVGCDRSSGMLRRARERVAAMSVVVADATALPLRDASFNLAMASFVLTHIRDYPRALAETLRVLKPSGRLAVSSWAPPSDPYSAAWADWLAETVTKPGAERAMREVAPWEEQFSQEGALEAALARAGFSPTGSEVVVVESTFTVDQFLEARELSAGGRFARCLLGSEGWARALAAARDRFHARFGSSFRYHRRAFIVTAGKP